MSDDQEYTSIPVTHETRDKVRSLKRGGVSYDTLVREMCADYESNNDGGQWMSDGVGVGDTQGTDNREQEVIHVWQGATR